MEFYKENHNVIQNALCMLSYFGQRLLLFVRISSRASFSSKCLFSSVWQIGLLMEPPPPGFLTKSWLRKLGCYGSGMFLSCAHKKHPLIAIFFQLFFLHWFQANKSPDNERSASHLPLRWLAHCAICLDLNVHMWVSIGITSGIGPGAIQESRRCLLNRTFAVIIISRLLTRYLMNFVDEFPQVFVAERPHFPAPPPRR